MCRDELEEYAAGRRIDCIEAIVAVLVIFVVDMTISGHFLFADAGVDPLEKADAIIVLGGEHDGREDYGLKLAREGWASTVVMSNPYGADDPVMRRVCHDTADIEVVCRRPEPLRRGARQSSPGNWPTHAPGPRSSLSAALPPASSPLIFRQCFSTTRARSWPQFLGATNIHYSNGKSSYAYQFGGFAKAFALGECL